MNCGTFAVSVAPPRYPACRFLRQVIKCEHCYFEMFLFRVLAFVAADAVEAWDRGQKSEVGGNRESR